MSKETMRMQTITATPPRRLSRRAVSVLAGLMLAVGLVLAPASPAAAETAWDVKANWGETEMRPGQTAMMSVTIRNIGRTTAVGQVKVEDHLPQGVSVDEIFDAEGWICFGETTLICKAPLEADPLYFDIGGSLARVGHRIQFTVDVSPDASGVHPNIATVSGGGASSTRCRPDHLRRPRAEPASSASCPAASKATTTPGKGHTRRSNTRRAAIRSSSAIDFDFNTMFGRSPTDRNPGAPYTKPIGRVRTIETILPRGLIGNAEAIPQCKGTELLGRRLGILPDRRLPGRLTDRLPEGAALERVLGRRLGLPQRIAVRQRLQHGAAQRRRR